MTLAWGEPGLRPGTTSEHLAAVRCGASRVAGRMRAGGEGPATVRLLVVAQFMGLLPRGDEYERESLVAAAQRGVEDALAD
jgi:hypothetical protein